MIIIARARARGIYVFEIFRCSRCADEWSTTMAAAVQRFNIFCVIYRGAFCRGAIDRPPPWYPRDISYVSMRYFEI